MNTTQGASAILKDSAIVLAILSSLLYLWGVVGDRAEFYVLGIPLGMMPERSVQEYLVKGGLLGLYFFLPAALLVWIIDLVAARAITRYVADAHLQGGFFPLVIYLTVLLASIAVVGVGVRLFTLMNKGPSFKVKSIRLTDNTKGMGNYEGLYLVTKSAKIYLFVDKFGEEATFYILSEDEVKELVVHRSQ